MSAIRAERDYVIHEDFMKVILFFCWRRFILLLLSNFLWCVDLDEGVLFSSLPFFADYFILSFIFWLPFKQFRSLDILFLIFLYCHRLCGNWTKQRNSNLVPTTTLILGKTSISVISFSEPRMFGQCIFSEPRMYGQCIFSQPWMTWGSAFCSFRLEMCDLIYIHWMDIPGNVPFSSLVYGPCLASSKHGKRWNLLWMKDFHGSVWSIYFIIGFGLERMNLCSILYKFAMFTWNIYNFWYSPTCGTQPYQTWIPNQTSHSECQLDCENGLSMMALFYGPPAPSICVAANGQTPDYEMSGV